MHMYVDGEPLHPKAKRHELQTSTRSKEGMFTWVNVCAHMCDAAPIHPKARRYELIDRE